MATYYVKESSAGSGNGSNWANAMSWATMLTTIASGDTAYVSGSISRTTSTDALSFTGYNTSPIKIIGCTEASDTNGYQGRSNGFGALVTTNFASVSYTSGTFAPGAGKTYIIIQNIAFSASSRNGAVVTLQDHSQLINCTVINTTNNASASGVSVALPGIVNCDVTVSGSSASTALSMSNGTYAYGCRLTCPNGKGVLIASAAAASIVNCVLYSCSIAVFISGTSTAGRAFVAGCTIQGCGKAFQLPGYAMVGISSFLNCMVTDNTTAWDSLYASTDPLAIARIGNRTRDNTTIETSGAFTNWPTLLPVTTDGGSQSSDYVAYASGDFRIVSTSPATGAGFPTGEIGAYQRNDNYPVIGDVKSGVSYGQANEFTGSYSAGGGADFPDAIMVGG